MFWPAISIIPFLLTVVLALSATGQEALCPTGWSAAGTTLETFRVPGLEDVDGSPYRLDGTPLPSVAVASPFLLARADILFLGRVEAVRYQCRAGHHLGIQGLAVIQFRVLRSFGAADFERITLATSCSGVPDCIRYEQPRFSHFDPGETFIFMGFSDELDSGEIWSKGGVFRLENGTLSNPYGDTWSWVDIYPTMVAVSRCHDLRWQFEHADLVALAQARDVWGFQGNNVLELDEVFKGSAPGDTVSVEKAPEYVNPGSEATPLDKVRGYHVQPRLSEGGRYLVFLQRTQPQGYWFLWGSNSCFVVDSGCVSTSRGIGKGSLADIVARFPQDAGTVDPSADRR